MATNHSNNTSSWRDSIALRVIALAFICIAGSLALTYYKSGFSDFWKSTLSDLPSWLFAFGTGLVVVYLWRNETRNYFVELLEALVVHGGLVKYLSAPIQLQLLHRCIDAAMPDCASAYHEMMRGAAQREGFTLKRRPTYELILQDLDADIEFKAGTQKLVLTKQEYLDCRVSDTVIMSADAFLTDATAVFNIGLDTTTGARLFRNFRSPACIYRDVVSLEAAHVATVRSALAELLTSNPDAVKSETLTRVGSLLLRIDRRVRGSWVQSQEIRPRSVAWANASLLYTFEKTQFDALGLAPGEDVRVAMIARSVVSRATRAYPIVFSAFSHDARVDVRITATGVQAHGWIGFLVSGAQFVVDDVAHSNSKGFSLSTKDPLTNKACWLFPGSGLYVYWN